MNLRKPPRRRAFRLDLHAEDVLGELGAAPEFLGRFSPAGLHAELERAGLIASLARLGYQHVRVSMSAVEGEHRLQVAPERGRTALVDLRMGEETVLCDKPWLAATGVPSLSCLSIRWLALQHPRGQFRQDRPRLPGQRWPGLGLGRGVYALVRRWAVEWGKDALLNHPRYFHNALFYAETFRFLCASRQGRFEAMRRDLAPLGPAAASWALEKKRVRRVAPGEPEQVAWVPGPMIEPLTPRVTGALATTAWQDDVHAAREATRYDVAPVRRRRPPPS